MRVLDFASPPLTASPLLQVWEMKKARDFTEADFFLNALVFGLFQRPLAKHTKSIPKRSLSTRIRTKNQKGLHNQHVRMNTNHGE
jgi:hypothetical protein